MKKVFLLTLLFTFLGCYNNESLKINELNFSDLNQNGILKNNIKNKKDHNKSQEESLDIHKTD